MSPSLRLPTVLPLTAPRTVPTPAPPLPVPPRLQALPLPVPPRLALPKPVALLLPPPTRPLTPLLRLSSFTRALPTRSRPPRSPRPVRPRPSVPSAVPSPLYSSFGFKEGTKTEKVVANGSSELKDKFPVEKKSYTCNLSASDIKSATVQNNGSSKVVTIVVKDDNPGTYSNSSKCVSTISIPIGTWTCKGVTLRGTIDANGRLTSLYYKMPTYVTQGSDAFAFSLEQNWTVAY